MPKAALFRRLAFAACVAALSAGAPAVARPVVQAQAAAPDGLAIPAVVAWLGEKGLTAGAVQTDGAQPYVRVTDGPLTWVLYFYSCQGQGERQVCPDLQFSAAFTNATVTPEITNRWNRENRFLKAFYQPGSAGGAGAAVAQLDVLVDSRSGLTELEDAVAVWRGLLPQFAREVGFLTGPAQP